LRDSRLIARACVFVISACAAVIAGVAASPAGAQSGGAGGTTYVAKPAITKVACVKACASRKRAKGGSTLALSGRSLAGVTQVVFLGAPSKGDDAPVPVRSGSDSALRVAVPMGAVSGSLAAVTSVGATSKPSPFVAILPPPPPDANVELSPVPGPRAAGAPAIETGTSRTRAFIGARHAVTFSYRVSDGQPASLTVELVTSTDGSVVKSWTPAPAPPGTVQSVSWSGTIGRAAAAPGRYAFRLTAASTTGAIARSSQGTDVSRDAFDLYDNVFPIRGRHAYGGGAGRFGAGRAGHTHQGQDVFARCGTTLVAARGGTVKYAGFQALAGNYVVIDGAAADEDYAYMHMAQPSPFRTGDRVYTGQAIGVVGDTGDAQGCHLHFELWGAPGWYDGGHPFDPLPALQAWDGWS
jgi:murein DD-endopeptidase MepM/ murein hydrolase activator NlpD